VTPEDINLLLTLAEIAGSAIQRTRYYEQMEQRLGQLSALRAIDVTISSSMDLRVISRSCSSRCSTAQGGGGRHFALQPHLQTLRFAKGAACAPPAIAI